MKQLETIDEARKAGATHLEVLCSRCGRSTAHLLDTLELRTYIRTLSGFRRAFRCHRCGLPATEVYYLKPPDGVTEFEFAIFVWDEQRLEREQVAVAAQSLDEAAPAFDSVARRYPLRWVTLQSRSALLRESGRPRREFFRDG